MRLIWLSVGLAILLLIPFAIWGDAFTAWFTGDAAIVWLRSWGALGWAAVLALLSADLVLPLPATGVMSAAGFVYGTAIGGALSALGSFLSGILAYGLCRRFGRRAVRWIAGADDVARGEALFRARGAWLVALSRCLPLLPEVIACLAGATRMPFRIFALSLACGCVPIGFIYAAIGAAGQDRPALALALSVAVPAVLWALVQLWLLRRKRVSAESDRPPA
ncbi:MAG: DedA family protein [Chthoniobacter sp.]|nr:DedA family protein [Chthoniobacter sp.]